MSERTWDGFLAYLYELPSRLRPGRQRVGVVRDNLQALIADRVRPNLTPEDEARLFPLGFSPSESDLKIAAGVGLERGWITPGEYEQAIRSDKAASPFGFLQTMSGKTFGETVAPLIARFWLVEDGDGFVKVSNRGLYDFGWTPHETGQSIRIELKASSEEAPNFQQIRHPRMSGTANAEPDYDVLLCLGLSNAGLEWWAFPADAVAAFIADNVFTPQHGGTKMESGTYWVRIRPAERERFLQFASPSESLREFVRGLDALARPIE